jgi:hypothetical protein
MALRNVHSIYSELKVMNFWSGFTPYVGRRFESIAPTIKEIISDAAEYGVADAQDRPKYREVPSSSERAACITPNAENFDNQKPRAASFLFCSPWHPIVR